MKTLHALAAVAVVGSIAVAVSGLARGGDLEHWVFRPVLGCPTQRLEAVESWTSTATPLEWSIRIDANGAILPGLPPCSGNDFMDAPGFKALIAAVDEWNLFPTTTFACQNVPLPDCGGGSPAETAVSTLLFSTEPRSVTASPSTSLIATGLPNVVSFLEPPIFFALRGGPFTTALAFVGAPGTTPSDPLTDFDIAFNALTPDMTGTTALKSWVQEDAGNAWASFLGAAFTPPVTGYVDIQGAFTHELGHAAGLGHAVIDGQIEIANGAVINHVPTMFAEGQIEPFTNLVHASSCSATGTLANGAAGTSWGGILGRSARTLEIDDAAAIGRGYPTTCFPQWTGTITGRALDFSGVGVPGLAVVAICRDGPNEIRASTLTYGIPGDTAVVPLSGTYTLSGLPPGRYFVYLEDVDQDVSSDTTGTLRYFNVRADAPNYLVSGILCGRAPCPPVLCSVLSCAQGCAMTCGGGVTYAGVREWGFCNGGLPAQRIAQEFWNVGESASDPLQAAKYLRVAAGSTLGGIDFVIQAESSADLRLEVRTAGCASCIGSRRGYRARATDVVEVAVIGPGTLVGSSVQVHFDLRFQNKIRNGQLFQVPMSSTCAGTPPTSMPFCTGGMLVAGPGGNAELRFDVDLAMIPNVLFQNIHAQAIVSAAGGDQVTNPVNLWVRQP